MSDDAALERARAHLFCAGVGDLGEDLCRANVTFGLAKMHHVQRQLGLAPDAIFIGAPDATATRNQPRWRQGYGYGGTLQWSGELAFVDCKPNGCGMLVGGLAAAPDEPAVRAAARDAREGPHQLHGVELRYDLHESNHFVDVCRLEEVLCADPPASLPEEMFVIHASGHEHRRESPFGSGLYYDESPTLERLARRVSTPWGPTWFLAGAAAGEYVEQCLRVQRFNRERREYYGRLLFGEHAVVCNATHQGFRGPGAFYIGAYWFDDQQQLFPLTLAPDLPLYLVRPRPNLTPDVLARLGWWERAEALGARGRLCRANVLPHGGGYRFAGSLQRVLDRGDHRAFAVALPDGDELLLEDIRQLPFGYRGQEVVEKLLSLELGDLVARYRIRFTIKE